MSDDTEREMSGFGTAPTSGGDTDDAERVRDACRTDREALSPRETSECAGAGIAEQYENEEDGGS